MDDNKPKESIDNRFDLTLKREMKRAARHKEPLSVVIIELLIPNDQYQKTMFIPVFKQVAGTIRRIIRDEDTEIILGRNVLLILPVTFLDGARTVASKIAKTVATMKPKDVTDFEMHLIFGFANFPNDGSDRQELLEVARMSLKNEKERLLKKIADKKK